MRVHLEQVMRVRSEVIKALWPDLTLGTRRTLTVAEEQVIASYVQSVFAAGICNGTLSVATVEA